MPYPSKTHLSPTTNADNNSVLLRREVAYAHGCHPNVCIKYQIAPCLFCFVLPYCSLTCSPSLISVITLLSHSCVLLFASSLVHSPWFSSLICSAFPCGLVLPPCVLFPSFLFSPIFFPCRSSLFSTPLFSSPPLSTPHIFTSIFRLPVSYHLFSIPVKSFPRIFSPIIFPPMLYSNWLAVWLKDWLAGCHARWLAWLGDLNRMNGLHAWAA